MVENGKPYWYKDAGQGGYLSRRGIIASVVSSWRLMVVTTVVAVVVAGNIWSVT